VEESGPQDGVSQVFTPAFARHNEPGRIVALGGYYPTAQVMDATGALRYIGEGGETGYSAADVTTMRGAVQWTKWINDLNKGRKWVRERLFERLDPMLEPGIALATVPSHDPFADTPPIRLLAHSLAASGGRVDATGCLVRHTKIKRIVWGGPSYRSLHRQTISVERADLIVGRTVLLLDDITKSGASLRACAELLRAAGAQTVQMMALGRVTAPLPPP